MDLSHEEIKRIETALKDEKFRKMFVEYAEEISNPENRRRYEEEIAMMENERGMDIQFINPEPGHVLKTTIIGGKKAFINICKNDKIAKPTSKKSKNSEGKSGLHWQIPHSFSPPREDFDKAKKTCMVYDVVFHPDTYRMTSNPNFLKLVEDTALEGIERQFDVKLDKNNIRRPKMKSKGTPVATVIRNRKDDANKKPVQKDPNDLLSSMPYPYGDKTSAELAEEKNKKAEERAKHKADKDSKTKSNIQTKEENGYTTPKYTITHRSNMDLQEYRNAPDSRPTTRPKELVINIDLPLCKSATGVDLDIFEDKLSLKSENPAYKLEFKLPYSVDDENGTARFDKSKKALVVTLPVVPKEIPKMPSFIDDKLKTDETNVPSLIQELPPLEKLSLAPSDLPPLEEINEDKASQVQKEVSTASEQVTKTTPRVSYNFPEYEFSQDTETVTFIIRVRNIKEETVCKAFPGPDACEIKFMSVGSGGYPMHYRVYVRFEENCKIVPEHCTTDVSDKNMVVTLLKGRESRTQWNKLYVGVDGNSLEEKVFLTANNLQAELDLLQTEGEEMGRKDERAADANPAVVKVTEMNEKKLTLKITKPKSTFDDEEEGLDGLESPLSATIEVIHTQQTPNLHGILKSRSFSESSEDHSSSSSGDSPTGTSPRDSDSSSGIKRSVSFSDHIDKTTFKSNASVTSMKQALKSKRKRQRKKEEKKRDNKAGRRRHNSSEGSSDDPDTRSSSESHSEEDRSEDMAQQLEETGKKTEEHDVIEEDLENEEDNSEEMEDAEAGENDADTEPSKDDVNKKPGYQIHSEIQEKSPKKGSKIAEQVKSKMAKKSVIDVNDSDDDIDSDRTSAIAEKEIFKTTEEIQHKEVYKTSVKKEKVVKKNVESDKVDLTMAENGKMAATNNSGGKNSDTGSAIGGKKSKKAAKKKGVKLKRNSHEAGSDKENRGVNEAREKSESDKVDEGEESGKSEVETELRWDDNNGRNDPNNEHKTNCAFTFSNAVMFDLDID